MLSKKPKMFRFTHETISKFESWMVNVIQKLSVNLSWMSNKLQITMMIKSLNGGRCTSEHTSHYKIHTSIIVKSKLILI